MSFEDDGLEILAVGNSKRANKTILSIVFIKAEFVYL